MAEAGYVGKQFRQIAHILRIQRAGEPHRESARPRQGSRARGWGKFLDSDEAPTLVSFDEKDLVDVAELLRVGAIAPYEPPAPAEPAEKARGKGAAHVRKDRG